LLTIQLRLVICSIDKAEAIGINWWRSDRFYSSTAPAATLETGDPQLEALRTRIDELEEKLSRSERKGR
jgi:hypothetical protein